MLLPLSVSACMGDQGDQGPTGEGSDMDYLSAVGTKSAGTLTFDWTRLCYLSALYKHSLLMCVLKVLNWRVDIAG